MTPYCSPMTRVMGNATSKTLVYRARAYYTESPVDSNTSHQTFLEHLGDLRGVLFRCLFALILGFLVCFHYVETLVSFLKEPLLKALPENNQQLYYFGLTEQFYTYMKVALVGGLALCFPFLLLQIGSFVTPALKPNEKKLVFPFVGAALLAFVLGFYCAYRWVLPYVFSFLLSFGSSTTEAPMFRLSEYISLTLQLLMGTALVFEIPVVLALLGKLGIVTAEFLRQFRAQAYIGLSVFAAIVTPTADAFSMVLALIPLYVLYELSILIIGAVEKKRALQ